MTQNGEQRCGSMRSATVMYWIRYQLEFAKILMQPRQIAQSSELSLLNIQTPTKNEEII
jgi:hypothetical protein